MSCSEPWARVIRALTSAEAVTVASGGSPISLLPMIRAESNGIPAMRLPDASVTMIRRPPPCARSTSLRTVG